MIAEIKTYVVLAIHPQSGVALDVELIATSPAAAISRTRGTLVHRDRDIAWLMGSFEITEERPFTR